VGHFPPLPIVPVLVESRRQKGDRVVSDFDPGPGWVEVSPTEATANREYVKHNTADTVQVWVREVPVPALPTAPYTVVRIEQRNDARPAVLTLAEDGYWYLVESTATRHSTATLAGLIAGFEVLAEPRAVTAKAVLDRVVETAILVRRDQIELIREEFGVSDE
jgi:hypothetical protein